MGGAAEARNGSRRGQVRHLSRRERVGDGQKASVPFPGPPRCFPETAHPSTRWLTLQQAFNSGRSHDLFVLLSPRRRGKMPLSGLVPFSQPVRSPARKNPARGGGGHPGHCSSSGIQPLAAAARLLVLPQVKASLFPLGPSEWGLEACPVAQRSHTKNPDGVKMKMWKSKPGDRQENRGKPTLITDIPLWEFGK